MNFCRMLDASDLVVTESRLRLSEAVNKAEKTVVRKTKVVAKVTVTPVRRLWEVFGSLGSSPRIVPATSTAF